MKHIILSLLFAAVATATIAQPGTLDNSFGNKGIVIGFGYSGYAYATALQKDGKIIAVGGGSFSGKGGVLLVRYNADGTLDTSFGELGVGVLITDLDGPIDDAYSVLVQDDGKILVAGEIGKGLDAGVLRYLPDGSPDSSFSGNGSVFTDLGDKEYVHAMVLQPDGKIVVAGTQEDERKTFTVRYLPDGSLDESFGDKGKVITTLQYDCSINCMTLQPDGKIIIAGVYSVYGNSKMLLIRYTPKGNLDQKFGVGGIVIIKFISGYQMDNLSSIALQSDEKIVIAGSSFLQYDVFMSLARFESNGSLDISFGSEGEVRTSFKTDVSYAKSVLIQPDGKIVAAGYAAGYTEANAAFALARYLQNGSLDASFGVEGLQTTAASITDGFYGNASVLQEDGKIVLVGENYFSIVLARYNGGDAVLPIAYNHFTAAQNKQYITLNWQTATEQNNRYFAIERSSNAVNYAAIAQVNSAGATLHEYNFTDKQPLQGTNYYRLKQTDADGKYSYSNVVSINYVKPGTILLLPNPAKDLLTVKGLNAAGISNISLLDIHGKLIQQFTAKQLTAYTFNISNLGAGTYMVRVKDNNGVATQKFVKQ